MPAPANGPNLASSCCSSTPSPACSPAPGPAPPTLPARSTYARAPRPPVAGTIPPPWPAILVMSDPNATRTHLVGTHASSIGSEPRANREEAEWTATRPRGNEFAEDVALVRKDARRQVRAGGGAEVMGEGGDPVPPPPSLVDAATMRAQQLAAENDLDPTLEQLQLLPEEAMCLAIHGMIDTSSAHFTGLPVTLADLWFELGFATCRHAAARFAAYHSWRSRDPPWVLKCGLKYGADFVLYSKGPNHGHAPFAVRIVPVETSDQVGQLPTHNDDGTPTAAAHHGVA
ncbi:hypothetical protein AMAG_05666 [Allomyces macrogynus ATCC 38327]|uniref:tRNA-intron lyase n=1 Tax=Allomyces macrogynus (strain ATCC 38327) TaxID=578462 RepID=A0A0L0SCV2_ALLM3|nr:hypothetical protein AMAG_05666 [Allomyces macrogynus ATCC 38327]|eukprot:KNE60254.1 hypothetical protein AMAG_05666 [Allomyces macrogynus ATCC 38327]